jgi:AraC-like DNA-binding protein
MSRGRLARTFRRALGCSVGTYLRRCRLDRAAQLLRETDCSIAEIAYSAGFYDQSHFTGAFGRWVGCPPGAFLELMRA